MLSSSQEMRGVAKQGEKRLRKAQAGGEVHDIPPPGVRERALDVSHARGLGGTGYPWLGIVPTRMSPMAPERKRETQ